MSRCGGACRRMSTDQPPAGFAASPNLSTVEADRPFHPAEDYHQDYFDREGGRNPYCMAVIAPKLRKFRKSYAERAKSLADAA